MANEKLDDGTIMKALEWGYRKAVDGGIPGSATAEELAMSYMRRNGTLRDKANSLIRWQNTKAATSGFVNGLPGLPFMPLTIPTSLTAAWYIQLRMVAAVAHLGGYDIRDDQVRTLSYVCLCGNGAKDVLKEIGVAIGTKLTQQAIRSVSGAAIVRINQAVGFRLLTKFGQHGVINLGKAVPIVGGVIGGAFDGIATNIIGNVARETFIPEETTANGGLVSRREA